MEEPSPGLQQSLAQLAEVADFRRETDDKLRNVRTLMCEAEKRERSLRACLADATSSLRRLVDALDDCSLVTNTVFADLVSQTSCEASTLVDDACEHARNVATAARATAQRHAAELDDLRDRVFGVFPGMVMSSCLVCYNSEGLSTMRPCGHLLCVGCHDRMTQMGRPKTCPACRAPIRKILRVYV